MVKEKAWGRWSPVALGVENAFEWIFGSIFPPVRPFLWRIAKMKSSLWERKLKKKEVPVVLQTGFGVSIVYGATLFILLYGGAKIVSGLGFSGIAEWMVRVVLLGACIAAGVAMFWQVELARNKARIDSGKGCSIAPRWVLMLYVVPAASVGVAIIFNSGIHV